MGKGIVEKLGQEFDIAVKWVGYELHPETPPEGKLLESIGPGFDADRMIRGLRSAGAPYGVSFSKITVIANSRLALEAGEFARDRGRFGQAHDRLFRGYFLEGQNIGAKPVIIELLKEIGLDANELDDALGRGLYTPRLQEALASGRGYGITAVPTFIVNEKQTIVGAQPYAVFQRTLQEL
ncbi:MAG: DsbA family protein [Bacillota bacterium]